ncbi:hypothetical protein EON82_18435 [bacterium]|nr:MAG: hypothetical protein EON82_18435 [bacterium]
MLAPAVLLLFSPQFKIVKGGPATVTKSGSATIIQSRMTKQDHEARRFFVRYIGPRISVLPVFYVPAGERPPSDEAKDLLLRHLAVAQTRYLEFMGGRDTFRYVPSALTFYSQSTSLWLATQPGDEKAAVLGEIMAAQRVSRSNAPYVYLVVATGGSFPSSVSARPINGGHNNGGGIALMNAGGLERDDFQSALQRELGHAFGLLSVDQYGYSTSASPSFMSNNPRHRWNGLAPSPVPAIAIPEDLRGLSMNRLAFPNFSYRLYDLPSGYIIRRERCPYPPMELGPHFIQR